MKLTIVYDNELFIHGRGLQADWGFACVIETEEDIVLFDTGARGDILLNNMKSLGLDPRGIDIIVLSHEHWDHTGGLTALQPFIDNATVYRLGSQHPSTNIRLVHPEESQRITEGVYTTGRLRGPVDEQSLVLNGKKGYFVFVGCSHPGVETILTAAKQYGDITGLIGGFHDFNDFRILQDLDFICPCHCTAHKKELQKIFPEKISECGVGKSIDIDRNVVL